MPLKHGYGRETVSRNIGEMMHSRSFMEGRAGGDPKKAQRMAVAAALRQAREDRRKAGAAKGGGDGR